MSKLPFGIKRDMQSLSLLIGNECYSMTHDDALILIQGIVRQLNTGKADPPMIDSMEQLPFTLDGEEANLESDGVYDWVTLATLLDECPIDIHSCNLFWPIERKGAFDEQDEETVKGMELPYVACREYDNLGGDSVKNALLGLLTREGGEVLNDIGAIVRAAQELCDKRGWKPTNDL